MKKEFIVSGKAIRLNDNQIVSALKGVKPGPVQTHGVVINGLTYPVKKALASVTGLDVLDFNTNQARNIFRRLGFKVVRVG